uniref:PH and SEC7 domain-containing protein 4 n=1 Tax=Varanus komodoensis TaxID=61221 RepID=A0A8D2KV60_VARKO
MDVRADDGTGEFSCDHGDGLGGAQALLAPSEVFGVPSFLCPEDVNSLQDGLEGFGNRTGMLSEKTLSALAQAQTTLLSTDMGPLGLERLKFSEKLVEPLKEELEWPESLKNQDKSRNDATQTLFWASILQAQMCVLDLQGEIDRQKEPLKISSLNSETVPVTTISQDLAVSHEPQLLDSDSEEEAESLERQEENAGSSEEEDEEYVFYNNPLFQDCPHPARTVSSEGLTLCSHPEGKAAAEDDVRILDSGLVSQGCVFAWPHLLLTQRTFFSCPAPSAAFCSCPEELSEEPHGTEETLRATHAMEPDGMPLANGTSGDQAAALRLAGRLYHLDGIKKSQVAAFLQKNNYFSQLVAEAYLSFFQFSRQTLDQALRLFLEAFVLTGETQERERILRHFSQRYCCCNPEAFLSPDAVHTLTCAIMLLNTDLHGQNIGRSMTCQDFLANLDGLNDGKNFPKELLKALYYSIRHKKLEWAEDDEEPASGKMLQPSASSGSLSSQKKTNPFLSLLHDPDAQVYRQGPLTRKVHAEADGKKTPWGRRSWKMFHTVLKGMVLYFFKLDALSSEEPIGVHHALAEKACQYTKRPHVFRLQTADWRVFLFQAPTSEEMSSWISRINLVAAMFSSPPFPAAVSSQRRFIRPVLPTAPCRHSLEDQHLAHENRVDKVSDELLEHQRNLPDKRGRSRDLEEYQLKKEYLLYEKRRYETYVRLLEVKISSATEDLDQWEAQLGEAAESCPGLQKSHSSPSLNVEGLPAGVKVKRNISERRTVRKIIPRRNKHLL